MEGVGPSWQVVGGPVMQWVEAWWDKLISRETMTKAWSWAVIEVEMAARPNVKVQGGAGAMFAALRRVGWTAPSADSMKTREGDILYFGDKIEVQGTEKADPRAVKR